MLTLLDSQSDDVQVHQLITSSLALCDAKGSESTEKANENAAGPSKARGDPRVTATATPIQPNTKKSVVSFRFFGMAAFLRGFGVVLLFRMRGSDNMRNISFENSKSEVKANAERENGRIASRIA